MRAYNNNIDLVRLIGINDKPIQSLAESGLAISKGEVGNTTYIHKFGYAPDFDTADGIVTIWDGADDGHINQMIYQYSTSAAIDSISSSDASDTQEIQIQGLDSNFNLISQEVILQGQTRVAIPTPLRRVFRLKNINSTDNSGYIYVYENTTLSGGVPVDSTTVRAIIEPSYNQTLMAVYTIPAGKTGYLRGWYASTAGASRDSNYIIRLVTRTYDTNSDSHKVWQVKNISSISDLASSYIHHEYVEPELLTEKTDIELRVAMTVAAGTSAAISGGFDLVLIDN